MDWSATLSLTTSRAQQHRPNYGSFGSSTSSLKRLGSASTISIPQSIPEHQCVVQFASPRLQHAELQIIEQYEIIGNDASKRLTGGSTTTLTITETPETSRLHTFKMLLTNPSATSIISRLDSGNSSKLSVAAPAASDDSVSSYWLQERERMRLQRERRHLTRNGSPVKAATLRDDDDPESSQWKTAAIMCSVPLVLVLVFVIVMLLYGDGLAGADAASSSIFNASASATGSSSRLRGSPAAASHGS